MCPEDCFRALLKWYLRLFHWLREASVVWLTGTVTLGAFVAVYRMGVSESNLRLAGLVLQVAGLATVALGVRDARRLFARPTLIERARKWLAGFPHWAPRYVDVSLSGRISAEGRAVGGMLSRSVDVNSTHEERIKALEENVQLLRAYVRDQVGTLRKTLQDYEGDLRKEKEARSLSDEDIRRTLESSQTGGLDITLMGLVWLFFGVLLSTASVELASFFS